MGTRGIAFLALAAALAADAFGGTNRVVTYDPETGRVTNPPHEEFVEANGLQADIVVGAGLVGAGTAESPLEIDAGSLPATGATNFGFGLVGDGTAESPLEVDPDVLPVSGATSFGSGLLGDGSEESPLVIDPEVVPTWDALETGDYVSVSSPSDGAFISHSGNAWVSQYGARAAIDYADWISSVQFSLAAGTGATSHPGQLVSFDGSTWSLVAALDHAAYSNSHAGNLAPAFWQTAWWTPFARKGDSGPGGSSGLDGDDGLDGVGNIQYGLYEPLKGYVYSTSSPIVVSYQGRWYDCVASSTSIPPGSAGATNFWTISIDKGADGELYGFTNLTFRGSWDVEHQYETNDLVTYAGNLFVVSNRPATGVAPIIDATNACGVDSAWWNVLVSRGVRGQAGVAGVPGANGSFVTNLFQSYIDDPVFNRVTNSPSVSNRYVRFSAAAGGTNYYEYSQLWSHDMMVAFIPENYAAESADADDHFSGIDAALAGNANHQLPYASIAGGTISISATSQAWRVTSSASVVATNWTFSGLDTNKLSVFLIYLELSTNTFAWPAQVTNAATMETNIYFLYRIPGGPWALE